MDSIDNLKEQINDFKALLNYGSLLNMEQDKINDFKKKIQEIENDITELTEIHKKFNLIFSESGWITYDSLNTDLMKQAINTYEISGLNKAEEVLLEYYKPEKLKYELIRLKAVQEIISRYKFIEYAFNDYKNERYYSVIPLLLMVIDGSIYDTVGRGFHAEKADLDVWDSITNANEGINKIRDIFKKGRRKTTQEIIDLPYRNGILHGIDLGYDNYKVAVKCWHFLFITRDWILAKKSENTRKAKFEEEKKIPSFTELAEKLTSIEKIKSTNKEWKPRQVSNEYINSLNLKKFASESLPESIAIKFLVLWTKKNYGYMAKLYSTHFNPDLNKKILEIREQFECYPIDSFKISKIIDSSPGISEITVEVKASGEFLEYVIRLLYEDSNSIVKPRSLISGNWKIAYVNRI